MLCQQCRKEIPEGKTECEFCKPSVPLTQNASPPWGSCLCRIFVLCLLIYGVNGLTNQVFGPWVFTLIRDSFASGDSSSGGVSSLTVIFSQISVALNNFDRLAENPMFWFYLLVTIAGIVIEIVDLISALLAAPTKRVTDDSPK